MAGQLIQPRRNRKSLEYWRKREELQRSRNITDEKRYAGEIRRIYQRVMDRANVEIEVFYARYAKKEQISMAEARKRVSRMDIEEYARKAKKYVREKDFSKQANDEMRLYNAAMRINRLEMLKANIGLEMVDGFDELEKYFGQKLTDRTLAEFERQAGILGSTIQDNQQLAHSIVNASFHNATFSDRIWGQQAILKNELGRLLTTGLIQGRHPRVLAEDLQKRFDVSRTAAERLMITELTRVQIDAQKKSYERNGYDSYTFIAEHDARTCRACAALDGKIFKVKDMEVGDNAPPIHPLCRCSTAAAFSKEDEKRYEEWLDSGAAAAGVAFEEFKNPLYRKGSTHRKLNKDGHHVIDKALYNKITKPAIRSGADIRRATGEIEKRLRNQNATAVTYGDVIFFREDATVSDVLEEVFHFYQNKNGVNAKYGNRQRSIMNEIQAKEYLLSVAEKYHIPEDEISLTKRQLESYNKEKAMLQEAGDWDE